MSKEFQDSLVHRTGMALAAVILLALVNMVASYLVAESSENDAVRINLAGSLRMQTYRIANDYTLQQAASSLASRADLAQAVAEFEKRLARRLENGYAQRRYAGRKICTVRPGGGLYPWRSRAFGLDRVDDIDAG